MTPHPNTPEGVTARVRENIRLLKLWKKLSDEDLAKHGGYTSRQLVCNRLSGRTPIDLEDMARLAAALHVEPEALWLDSPSRLMAWVEENSDYRPPKVKKQSARKAATA